MGNYMPNRIHPNWETINNFHNPLTPGEEKLAHFLDAHLSEKWMIFVEPYLNGSRPDIVAFNPEVGVMIYEVKDWDLKFYHRDNNGKLFVNDKQGSYQKLNPTDQVVYYKNKIIKQLIPILGEQCDKNREVYGIIKTGVYFHNATGQEARNFFEDVKHTIILGHDDLNSERIEKILPNCKKEKDKRMQSVWVNEILFWLRPPFHSLEQTQNIELSDEQKKHAEPQPGHYRLRGVAGSGKSLVLAYRAAKLASQGKKVLVLTFNKTLWHFIKDIISRTPFEFEWENITFNHFHGFCNDTLINLGTPKLISETYLDDIVPCINKAHEACKDIEKFKFDAILIDEGQDFNYEWYDLLRKFLTNRNELFLVIDKRQSLYSQDLIWVEGGMKNVEFRGPWRELKRIYRLPKIIGNIANDFSKIFCLNQEVQIEEYKQLTIFEAYKDPHLIWENIDSTEWMDKINKAYEKIKITQIELGIGHPSDTVILLPNHKRGMELVRNFKKRGIEVNHVFGDSSEESCYNKGSFYTGDSRLKMSTIHSFKGWEAVNVILLIPFGWLGSEDNLNALVYVAMTRAQVNLIVLNCNQRYNEFGGKLPSIWQ